MDTVTSERPRTSRIVRLILAWFVLMGLSGCCCCVIPVAEKTGRQFVAEKADSVDRAEPAVPAVALER